MTVSRSAMLEAQVGLDKISGPGQQAGDRKMYE